VGVGYVGGGGEFGVWEVSFVLLFSFLFGFLSSGYLFMPGWEGRIGECQKGGGNEGLC
jgi:hypothetical protein